MPGSSSAVGLSHADRLLVRTSPTASLAYTFCLGGWSVTWVTTTDVRRFLADAGPFLVADPVANTALLTEAHFWRRLSDEVPGARFGWWHEGGEANGAFVHVPDHALICSALTQEAVAALGEVSANATHLGVQATDMAAVTAAWRRRRKSLLPRAWLTLLRLHEFRDRTLPEGTSRRATTADLPLLRSWFRLFQERNPEDASHVEFVVDHPVEEGCVIVWEVAARPVAMASRTPPVAGMARMGLAFQPTRGRTYADAAFDRGCAEAAQSAEHVLVLSASPGTTEEYRSLGFAAVLDRVVLEVLDDH
jgi:hypothetical protein